MHKKPASFPWAMGTLFDICRSEFERLRPLYEEQCGVDLSEVRFLNPREFASQSIRNENILPLKGVKALTSAYCAASYPAWYDAGLPAITVNERVLQKRDMPPAYAVAHELGHATQEARAHLDPNFYGSLWTKAAKRGLQEVRGLRDALDLVTEAGEFFGEVTKVQQILLEGGAIALQSDYLTGLDTALAEHTADVREALLDSAHSGMLNSLTAKFSAPWDKIRGYAFFHAVMQDTGKEGIWLPFRKPALSMEEIGNPAAYLGRA